MTAKVFSPSRTLIGCCAAVAVVIACLVSTAGRADAAQPPVGLGAATSYAVLAGSAITNTGPSVVNGDVGVSPLTSISGFPPGLVNGTTHSADAEALQAKADLTLAYVDAASRGPATAVATELGGVTLDPGTYSGATLGMTGTLTLDAHGDPDAVFLIKSAATLVTASNSAVVLAGNANPCNVYWQITSSATLGTGTAFVGSIMAMEAITANTGATVQGRLLARTAAVTLDTNVITRPTCATTPAGTTTTTAAPATTSTTIAGTTSTTAAPATTSTTAPAGASTSTTLGTTSTTTVTGGATSSTLPSTTSTLPGVDLAGGPGPGPTTTVGPRAPASPGGPDTPGQTTSTLARTGTDPGHLVELGLLALGLGTLMVGTSRRRIRAS